jgi:translation initiation factor 3 subunit I
LFEEKEDKAHMEPITDMQRSQDGTYFVSSSKDKTAKVRPSLYRPSCSYSFRTIHQIWSVGPDKTANGTDYLTLIKTFAGETPLNSAAIIPNKPYIICGGGQEAMAVTTTSARQGGFEIRFWHRVFEEEVARVKGGFGPCNT